MARMEGLLLRQVALVWWFWCLSAASALQFSGRGQFKILQVADMHYANGKTTACRDVLPEQVARCSDLNTTAFLERMIRAEKPDLIVFTGDNIYGSDTADAVKSMDAAFAPAVAAGIPWAAVLGNHDQESTLTREGLMNHIVTMKHTLSLVNPPSTTSAINGKEPHIDGFGNYNLEVLGADGSKLQSKSVLNLYFLDSGDYAPPSIGGYDWIKTSQQAWFQRTSFKLQKNYTSAPEAQSEPAPGLVYFHIPLQEYARFDASNFTGVKLEPAGNGISSSKINSGFFSTMVKAGDVRAVFTGHDHLNDFCGKLSDINLCYAGGFGYHAYGKAGWSRRARVVLVSLEKDKYNATWGGVKSIRTWKRLDDAPLSKIDEQTLWQKVPSGKPGK
ncbi:probable inactive purple acid phosphatase 29 [Nymphaea colorata]|nr:probable inactive purple acid phosphatase 29 [Nymphaea colorata]